MVPCVTLGPSSLPRTGGTQHHMPTTTGRGMWWYMTGCITTLTRTSSGYVLLGVVPKVFAWKGLSDSGPLCRRLLGVRGSIMIHFVSHSFWSAPGCLGSDVFWPSQKAQWHFLGRVEVIPCLLLSFGLFLFGGHACWYTPSFSLGSFLMDDSGLYI